MYICTFTLRITYIYILHNVIFFLSNDMLHHRTRLVSESTVRSISFDDCMISCNIIKWSVYEKKKKDIIHIEYILYMYYPFMKNIDTYLGMKRLRSTSLFIYFSHYKSTPIQRSKTIFFKLRGKQKKNVKSSIQRKISSLLSLAWYLCVSFIGQFSFSKENPFPIRPPDVTVNENRGRNSTTFSTLRRLSNDSVWIHPSELHNLRCSVKNPLIFLLA